MRIKPKATKFRKSFKRGTRKKEGVGREQVKRTRGDVGLIAIETGRVTARQIEAGRRTRRQNLNRLGRVWIGVFPAIPVTKKPSEVRIGKGKGNVETWIAHVTCGKRRFEVQGVSITVAISALKKAGNKIPIKTKRVLK